MPGCVSRNGRKTNDHHGRQDSLGSGQARASARFWRPGLPSAFRGQVSHATGVAPPPQRRRLQPRTVVAPI